MPTVLFRVTVPLLFVFCSRESMVCDGPWGDSAYDGSCCHNVLHVPFLSLVDAPRLPRALVHLYPVSFSLRALAAP